MKDRPTTLPSGAGLLRRVCVDLTLEVPSCMEIEAYSETMIRALAKAAPKLRITLIVPIGAARTIALPNVDYHSLPAHDGVPEGTRQIALPSYLAAVGADCLFAPAALLPLAGACPMISVVHDLAFETHPETYSQVLRDHLRRWFEPSLGASDLIVATSGVTMNDLLSRKRIAGEKVVVIESPVRESLAGRLSELELNAELSKMQIARPFFLHASNLCGHKNIEFALRAVAQYWRTRVHASEILVIAGLKPSASSKQRIFDLAKFLGIVPRVRYVVNCADRSLKALYQGCAKFLFPSLAEGWSPQVQEARSLGASVLASASVVSASSTEQLPLGIDRWVEAMEARKDSAVVPSEGLSLAAAGSLLLDAVVEARVRSGNRGRREGKVHSILGEDSQQLRSGRVAVRGDWYSPSGFGEAARTVSEALATAGVVTTAIGVPKDTLQDRNLWAGEIELGAGEADLWIHSLPPEYIDPALTGKHTAFFFWETDRLPTTDTGCNWTEKLSCMDELWVPSEFVKTTLERSGISVPVAKVPLPVDSQLFSPGSFTPLDVDLPPGFDSSWTVFLYVGTWDFRKRPDILVRCFTTEFTDREKVLLLVKSYVTGDPSRDREILTKRSTQARAGSAHLRIIPEVLSRERLADLYRLATAFVTASHGEGYCLPAVQAMSCGIPVVAAGWSALRELAAIPVDYQLKHVPETVTLRGYSSQQRWADIDVADLSRKLRWTHENGRRVRALGAEARHWVEQNASLPVVGAQLRRRIEGLSSRGTRNVLQSGKGV